MAKITVAIADDHELLRTGVHALLANHPDLEVIGDASDGLEAIRLAERLRPNVMLLDLAMPHLNGLEALLQITRRCPDTRVIVLSMHSQEKYVLEALRWGAYGYALKTGSAHDLVHAIREVAAGRRYLSPPLSEKAFAYYVDKAQTLPPDPLAPLTPREREILYLVVEGHTSKKIAELLRISIRTVETHRFNLMSKLRVRNQLELFRWALEHGVLTPQHLSPQENVHRI